jgi:hypothetical protein
MKRALAVLCFALVFPALLGAGPAVPPRHPAASATVSRVLKGIFSFLRSPWRFVTDDGGHDYPPPSSPSTLSGS